MARVVLAKLLSNEILSDFVNNKFALGDKNGRWAVVEDEIILGRYHIKDDAEEHARSLNETTTSIQSLEDIQKLIHDINEES